MGQDSEAAVLFCRSGGSGGGGDDGCLFEGLVLCDLFLVVSLF